MVPDSDPIQAGSYSAEGVPYRLSRTAPACRRSPAPIQTCQCERGPSVKANCLAHFMSAARRQIPSANAMSENGVSNAAVANAKRWFRVPSRLTLGPGANRIVTFILNC